MFNSGKKICALRDKIINILTLVLSEKKFLNETKNHNPPPPPPFQVKWSVPNDQGGKKTLVKRIFFTCMEFIQFKLLCFNLIL